MRTTHTYAQLEISRAAYDEIATKLREAGYDHCFIGEDGMIAMQGIAVIPAAPPRETSLEGIRAVGVAARRAGYRSNACPYRSGTAEAEAWTRGWDYANAEMD